MEAVGKRLAVAVVALGLALSGCSGGSAGSGGGAGGGSAGGSGGGSGGGAGGAGGGGAGSATAEVSVTPVDFASVGCAAAATTKKVTVKNTGTAALTFSTSVAGASSFKASPASGMVAGGASADVIVSAAVPSSANAGVDQTATLTINTSDSAHAKFDVPLKLKTSGVTLALVPTVASFGVLPVGIQAPNLPLTLTNNGNVPATLSFTQPADAQFGLTWAGSPGAATVGVGASVAMLAARFKPSKITASSAPALIGVAEPVCGTASVFSIPMTGQGTNGVVGFSSTDVFFGTNGRVDCGTQAAAKTFTITNGGNQAFAWTGTLGKGASSPFSFSPTSGTVPANNGSITITVNTTAGIPAVASTAAEAFGDTLSIVTDVANDTSHPITLHQTANGAILSLAPSSLDFGLVPINNTANAPFSVVNDGNAAASVTLTSDNTSFNLNPAGPTAINGGASGAVTATFAPGTSVVPQTAHASAAVDAATVLCAPLPPALTMTGTGTNGSVSYSPVALDFGAVNCGTSASAKTVTFTNNGNQAYTVSAALGKGASSSFTISMSPDSGVVASDGGTVVITATPGPIPQTSPVTPNLYGDTLTVTTNVSADSPHDIPLRETARGSIFAISTTSINFGSVAVGANASSQFTASNTGNAAGTISFTSGQPAIFNLPINAVVSPNTNSSQTGNFTPVAAMGYSDTANITLSSGTVLCQPLPFSSISLSGSGSSGNVVALSASSLTFGAGGLVPCGTTAGAQTVSVTNNSSQTLSLSFALTGGAGSAYTVSGPATVAASQMATVTITPKAIPATSSTATDAFADTLSITATGGVVNEAHTVALHETAEGAILTFNPSAISYSASGSKAFTVNNSGNLSAPYTLAVGGANASLYSVSPTAGTVSGGGSVSSSATYARPLLGGATAATVTMSSSVGRCAPLPAPLALTGN